MIIAPEIAVLAVPVLTGLFVLVGVAIMCCRG